MSGTSEEIVAPQAPQRIVILGATSAIAEAAARLWATRGARIVLAGRNEARLNEIAADLKARGAGETFDWPLDFVSADASVELAKMVDHLGGLATLRQQGEHRFTLRSSATVRAIATEQVAFAPFARAPRRKMPI